MGHFQTFSKKNRKNFVKISGHGRPEILTKFFSRPKWPKKVSDKKSFFMRFGPFPDFFKKKLSKNCPVQKNHGPTPHQHLTYAAQLNAIPPNTQLGRPTANQTHPDTHIQVQPHIPNPKSAQTATLWLPAFSNSKATRTRTRQIHERRACQ